MDDPASKGDSVDREPKVCDNVVVYTPEELITIGVIAEAAGLLPDVARIILRQSSRWLGESTEPPVVSLPLCIGSVSDRCQHVLPTKGALVLCDLDNTIATNRDFAEHCGTVGTSADDFKFRPVTTIDDARKGGAKGTEKLDLKSREIGLLCQCTPSETATLAPRMIGGMTAENVEFYSRRVIGSTTARNAGLYSFLVGGATSGSAEFYSFLDSLLVGSTAAGNDAELYSLIGRMDDGGLTLITDILRPETDVIIRFNRRLCIHTNGFLKHIVSSASDKTVRVTTPPDHAIRAPQREQIFKQHTDARWGDLYEIESGRYVTVRHTVSVSAPSLVSLPEPEASICSLTFKEVIFKDGEAKERPLIAQDSAEVIAMPFREGREWVRYKNTLVSPPIFDKTGYIVVFSADSWRCVSFTCPSYDDRGLRQACADGYDGANWRWFVNGDWLIHQTTDRNSLSPGSARCVVTLSRYSLDFRFMQL